MPAAGHNDQTPNPSPQPPPSGTEYHQTAVLVHSAWAGWYYEAESENELTAAH